MSMKHAGSANTEFHEQAREYPKLPKLRDTTNCRPKYVRTVNYNDYGDEESQEIRDSETKSKCSVNEFVYLTYCYFKLRNEIFIIDAIFLLNLTNKIQYCSTVFTFYYFTLSFKIDLH
jgi:hypothetical protein